MHSYYIDRLRVFSAFSVVLIHVVYQSVLYCNGGGYILPFNLLCFGVPCFLMITGKLQLDKQEYSMSKCLKKVVIPLLFWGVVFALMEIVFDERNIQIEYIFTAFYKVLTGQSWAHLWYLYMLVGIY